MAHAERLEQALPDLKPPYTPGQAVAEANRCLYCDDAPCIAACPTGIDIPGFIRKIATGNLKGSARTILSANLLGYSCARVCPVEVLCAGACVYQHQGHATIADRTPAALRGRGGVRARRRGDAVAPPAGQRHARSPASARDRRRSPAPATSRSRACAVTVFEKRALPGGLNTTGVAPYKMHAEDALREVELVRELGVDDPHRRRGRARDVAARAAAVATSTPCSSASASAPTRSSASPARTARA